MLDILLSYLGGRQQSASYKAQEQAARAEAQMADIRGLQIGENARSQLATVLGNINAIRATRGASLDSATGQAIEARTRKDALRQEAIGVLAEANRAGAARNAAAGFKRSAQWALPMALLQGVNENAKQAFAMMGR
jgi:hypothetical protein